MSWNNSYERKVFEQEQKELANEYKEAGMTEEQIQAMYQFDLDSFNSNRRFYEHTQALDFEDEKFDCETRNPLLEKFKERVSTTPHVERVNSFDWIEEINNQNLYRQMKALTTTEKTIITLIVHCGYTQKETAKICKLTRPQVSYRVEKIKRLISAHIDEKGGIQ